MSDKRFRCAVSEDIIRDMPYVVVEHNTLYKIDKVVDLLNEIAEENVFLRFEVSHLQKENEELKQEVKQYWKYRDVRKQKTKDLEKENKELKQQLDKIPENIRKVWLE